MKAVIQRVNKAEVWIEEKLDSSIDKGLLIFVAFLKEDTEEKLSKFVDKILNLRIFEDESGKMNYSVLDRGYDVMVVSNFTLGADVSKGRRPSFSKVMEPDEAKEMFDKLCSLFEKSGLKVGKGVFGKYMEIKLVNDGPVTIFIEV